MSLEPKSKAEWFRLRPISLSCVLCAVSALALLQLTACTIPNTDVKGSDQAALLPAGRLSWTVVDRTAQAAAPATEGQVALRKRHDFKLKIELDVSNGEGEFTQNLLAGEQLDIGGQSFLGPGAVDVDFELSRASIVVRAANRFSNNVGLDGFLGVGRSELDIRLRQAAHTERDNNTTYGPLLGATLAYYPLEPLRLFCEGSLHMGFAEGFGTVLVTSLDIGASVALGEHVEFVAGWRRLTYEADYESDYDRSDLDLKLRGPLLALHLGF